uniref:Uncharacterized protein n=1 Tax=Oryza barthii TaxID=65489 RepID=A0A0D3HK46_9ORYZ
MAIEFFPKLASCFRPPSSSSSSSAAAAAAARRGRRQEAAARRRPDKAEKKRWVDEQVGLHLAARYCAKRVPPSCSVLAVGNGSYGDIGLEAALGYEFERRWWFAEMARLLALVDEDDAAAAAGNNGDIPPAVKGVSGSSSN